MLRNCVSVSINAIVRAKFLTKFTHLLSESSTCFCGEVAMISRKRG